MMKFPRQYFDRLTAIVRKDKLKAIIDREEFQERMEALLAAVAAPYTGDKFVSDFRKAADDRVTDKQLADQFKKIAKANDPLDPQVCCVDALVRLEALARKRWAEHLKRSLLNRSYHLIKVDWDQLTDWQQVSVREMARELEKEHRSRIIKGAPGKYDHNALLIELADEYLKSTDKKVSKFGLPHAIDSNFIQFVHTALEPFYAKTEVTPSALSKRWKRIKEHHRKRPGDIKPTPKNDVSKKIRKRPNSKK